MQPQDLLPPMAPQGLPAPLWFLTFFKVVGFVLHLWPMHLFYAGTIVAAVLALQRDEQGRRLAQRLGRVLPFAVALGVNFGVVPLLFVQVSHYRVFYPSTILMAWPWFSIIPMLTLGYYGIYLYAYQARHERVTGWGRGGIVLAAAFFAVIGFLFVNCFSLMTHVGNWSGLLAKTSVSGAVTGLALNTGDATMWPRWLMMFGLALCSVGAWVAVDTAFFSAGDSEDYRQYARRRALGLYLGGALLFELMGAVYTFVALPPTTRAFLLGGPMLLLFALTAVAPGLGLVAVAWQTAAGRAKAAWGVIAAHYVVLVLNAVSRQMVQSFELSPLNILGAEQLHTQWSTLPLFLVCFVAALALLGWMLRRVWVEAGLGRQQPEG